MPGKTMTWVDLLHVPGRIERSLRFGRPADRRQIDAQRERLGFAPRAVFAILSLRDEAHCGSAVRLSIVRAVAKGEAFSLLPYVAPGAEILLDLKRGPQIVRALAAIDDVERQGFSVEQVAPDHWVNLAGRIASGLRARSYDQRMDRAWRARRRPSQ